MKANSSEEPFFYAASSARKHVYTSCFERFKQTSGKLAIPKIREQISTWRFSWAERKKVVKRDSAMKPHRLKVHMQHPDFWSAIPFKGNPEVFNACFGDMPPVLSIGTHPADELTCFSPSPDQQAIIEMIESNDVPQQIEDNEFDDVLHLGFDF